MEVSESESLSTVLTYVLTDGRDSTKAQIDPARTRLCFTSLLGESIYELSKQTSDPSAIDVEVISDIQLG